jgi:hypothetical protein
LTQRLTRGRSERQFFQEPYPVFDNLALPPLEVSVPF